MLKYLTKDEVAALLFDKRRQMGLTGQEVSDKLKMYGIDLSKTTIWGYEKGVSGPTVPTFLALCRIYEVCEEVEEFVTDDHLSDEEIELLSRFRNASSEVRGAAFRVLQPVEKENTSSLVG